MLRSAKKSAKLIGQIADLSGLEGQIGDLFYDFWFLSELNESAAWPKIGPNFALFGPIYYAYELV
ncbi:MAG TPA: hypothetical protein P5526_29455 [Anaerolineae bacterium]|nr:hypothetical protein [Anaerolineae bacterium]